VITRYGTHPYADNGIKFLLCPEQKLPDSWAQQSKRASSCPRTGSIRAGLGKARRPRHARAATSNSCKSTFSNELVAEGVKIVVDAATAPRYPNIAPDVFHPKPGGRGGFASLCSPNGTNHAMTVSAATSPGALIAAVKVPWRRLRRRAPSPLTAILRLRHLRESPLPVDVLLCRCWRRRVGVLPLREDDLFPSGEPARVEASVRPTDRR